MKLLPILSGLLVGAFLALAVTVAAAPTDKRSELMALNQTRAPTPVSSTITQLTISGVSAAVSAALNAPAVYSIVCSTDVYLEFNDSSPTASSADGYLPAKTVLYWSTRGETTNSARWVAAIQVSASGTCYIKEHV